MTITALDDLPEHQKAAVPVLFGLPVKHGVTRINLLAIVFIPLVLMLLQTYLNA